MLAFRLNMTTMVDSRAMGLLVVPTEAARM
jgi:hypothetical protein